MVQATTLLVLILHLLLIFPQSSSFHQQQQAPSPLPQGSSFFLREDKVRLGSRPPNCYNRCNECNPCMAVQVPTLPSPVKQHQIDSLVADKPLLSSSSSTTQDEKFSNYKALGWKCRCGHHFYNPYTKL